MIIDSFLAAAFMVTFYHLEPANNVKDDPLPYDLCPILWVFQYLFMSQYSESAKLPMESFGSNNCQFVLNLYLALF